MDSQPPLPPPSFPISDASPPILPRRVARACASCRRDKIRCDGSRPCAGCLKKGYAPDQCIDGCEHCRRARMRCEGGKPCLRCREMQLDCIEEITVSSTGRTFADTSAVLSQANSSDRARLACQNCRKDNKKCDNQRPCSRCIARAEECIHVGRGPKLVKLRCEGCRMDNKRCEDARPCHHCIESGRECTDISRRSGGHGTRVKAACTNCRRDKIRCEGTRPCLHCIRRNYQCTDRACPACIRRKGAVCTHLEVPDTGSSQSEADDSAIGQLAFAQMPVNPGGQLPQPPLPPIAYSRFGYNYSHYNTPPPILPTMTGQLQSIQPAPSVSTSPGLQYYPVIDPSIDDSVRLKPAQQYRGALSFNGFMNGK